jgi:hypothetical protein
MKSSPLQSQAFSDEASTSNHERRFAAISQRSLFEMRESASPGSMNDSSEVRAALVDAIRKSGKSRAQLADEMTRLTGTEVTVRRINAFTAESREDYRFPSELTRAFCMATGDFSLLYILAELAGLHVVTAEEMELLELGRQFLKRKSAEERINLLEAKLHRRGL